MVACTTFVRLWKIRPKLSPKVPKCTRVLTCGECDGDVEDSYTIVNNRIIIVITIKKMDKLYEHKIKQTRTHANVHCSIDRKQNYVFE